MATSIRTTTDNYIKIEGENVPINLAATGVRCITCQQFCNPDQLQKHLSSHVNPSFVRTVPVFNSTTPQKPNLSSIINDPQKVDDIWVKTFLPADLPAIQREKKVAHRPTGEDRLLNTLPFYGITNFESNPKKEIQFSLGETVDESVQSEQQLNIKKNIKVGRVQNEINKKQLHFYMNQRDGSRNFDPTIVRSKKIKDDISEETDAYSVNKAPLSQQETSLLTPRKQNKHTYHLSSGVKNPANALRITTVSRYEQREPEEISEMQKSRSTVVGALSRYVPPHQHQSSEHEGHNHTCPCCKGFYCSVCKSSVPPIYRPVPDKDGNYHFHPRQNEQSVEFYRDHYYPNDRNVCTHCSKEMVNGRILQENS